MSEIALGHTQPHTQASPESRTQAFHPAGIGAVVADVRQPVHIVRRTSDGAMGLATSASHNGGVDVMA